MKTITNDLQRMTLVREISSMALPFRVEIHEAGRSLEANALSHVWYGEIGKRDPEYNTVQARRFCKLHFGVPILRGQSDKFRAAWDGMIKARLTYPEKLELMDWWPVTSLMDRSQMREYLTAMQDHWQQRGVMLTGLDRGHAEYPEAAA